MRISTSRSHPRCSTKSLRNLSTPWTTSRCPSARRQRSWPPSVPRRVKSRLVLSLGLSIGAVGVEPGVNGSIVIHTYRWWLGRAEGEPHYDELEKRLAT